ncbi:VPLPA-CTERM sorting domain-containing protein [Nitrospira lenta]|uniref:Uncharacterized protein n=1 Tax=Nitrospira lenta TaxID=1436998 RepID=A0A330KZK1_9BACT|nr:VPLPA-CTERM sorting domain-containing protein [Nitrospira lenta]SPP62951.1 conserved exported hypothetical protein [Nitrospira lenta]
MLKQIMLGSVALVALAFVQPIGASADLMTLTASHDATIFENAFQSGGNGATQSNGAGPGMFAGSNSNQSPRRGLLAFDIAGALPVGAIINSAQVQLTVGQVAGSGGSGSGGDQITRTIELYRMNTEWGEGTTGSTATMIGGTGQGFAANPGDATWTQNKFNQSSWTTPGGLGNANATASASVQIQGGLAVGGAQNQTFTWGSTAQLVADVQAMLNTPSTNYGWLLRNVDEVDNPSTPTVNEGFQSFRAFYTKEGEALGLGTGPRLLIDYTVAPIPVPAAVWLFGSGLAAVAGIARRKAVGVRV